MKKHGLYLSGVLIGLVNGLLGAGGGMLAVPLLKKAGLDQTKAQASSIAVIFPLTAVSAAVYLINKSVSIDAVYPYLIPGAVGSVIGAVVLSKIPQKILKKIFALFMLWAGIRMMVG